MLTFHKVVNFSDETMHLHRYLARFARNPSRYAQLFLAEVSLHQEAALTLALTAQSVRRIARFIDSLPEDQPFLTELFGLYSGQLLLGDKQFVLNLLDMLRRLSWDHIEQFAAVLRDQPLANPDQLIKLEVVFPDICGQNVFNSDRCLMMELILSSLIQGHPENELFTALYSSFVDRISSAIVQQQDLEELDYLLANSPNTFAHHILAKLSNDAPLLLTNYFNYVDDIEAIKPHLDMIATVNEPFVAGYLARLSEAQTVELVTYAPDLITAILFRYQDAQESDMRSGLLAETSLLTEAYGFFCSNLSTVLGKPENTQLLAKLAGGMAEKDAVQASVLMDALTLDRSKFVALAFAGLKTANPGYDYYTYSKMLNLLYLQTQTDPYTVTQFLRSLDRSALSMFRDTGSTTFDIMLHRLAAIPDLRTGIAEIQARLSAQ